MPWESSSKLWRTKRRERFIEVEFDISCLGIERANSFSSERSELRDKPHLKAQMTALVGHASQKYVDEELIGR